MAGSAGGGMGPNVQETKNPHQESRQLDDHAHDESDVNHHLAKVDVLLGEHRALSVNDHGGDGPNPNDESQKNTIISEQRQGIAIGDDGPAARPLVIFN